MRKFSILPRTPGIYQITNTINGKKYIGSSKDIRRRWRQHYIGLENNSHHCAHLQHSWNKYGESVFEFELLQIIEDEPLRLKAEDIILRSSTNIFNSAKMAINCQHSAETRLKIGLSNKGKKLSSTTKMKIQDAMAGVKKSELHKLKIGTSQIGKTIPLETRMKMSEIKKGKIPSLQTREKRAASMRRVWQERRSYA